MLFHSSSFGVVTIVQMFKPSGTFVYAWGQKGSQDGDTEAPTCLCYDSKGRIYVGEYANDKVQVFAV